jgi:hypothetical protein
MNMGAFLEPKLPFHAGTFMKTKNGFNALKSKPILMTQRPFVFG